jgi:hypothetical protein
MDLKLWTNYGEFCTKGYTLTSDNQYVGWYFNLQEFCLSFAKGFLKSF